MPRFGLAAIVLLLGATSAFAHRVDEYLQAAMFSVEKDHVALNLRLTPGVEVFGKVLAVMDRDGDGALSPAEQRAYAEQVGRDLALSIDGRPVPLRLGSCTFPTLDEMKQGLGEIVLDFEAPTALDDRTGDPSRRSSRQTPFAVRPAHSSRRLVFENHHLPVISVYLVNCFVPSDPGIRVVAQDRNYQQSFYQLDYLQEEILADEPNPSAPPPSGSAPSQANWLDRTGSASLFKAYFYQGVRHILTGYDHLLFVTALVLAATTLWELIKVVATFTLAHTITLTLAAMNLISLPAWVVEPLIAASIVFVAVQNVFWPRRAKGWSRLGAAFFFGLFHGLGFAGGLLDAMREMPSGTMFVAILAFSIGVETGHQMVVLPLFALLSAARRLRPDAVERARLSLAFQRIGSAGISVAGVYYLCLAIRG
jgi:hydrogenase/urease accessory protein HupE